MTRALFHIVSDRIRANVIAAITKAPHGTRVEINAAQRSLPQNDRMWAMLTDVSKQHVHMGQRYTPDIWKSLFMHELGRQCEFVPALAGETVIPLGFKSSDLSVAEMRDLITVIEEWGARNGIVFHDDRQEQEA